MHTFYLPYPVALNHYYAHTGRVYLSERGKAFRDEAALYARTQASTHSVEPLPDAVAVTVRVYNGRMDIDAPLKATLDALNGIAWLDDGQIKRLVVELIKDKHGKRMEVDVSAL